MTTKNAKTILFASLIAAMILPFSGMNFAYAEKTDKELIDEWNRAFSNDTKSLENTEPSDEIKVDMMRGLNEAKNNPSELTEVEVKYYDEQSRVLDTVTALYNLIENTKDEQLQEILRNTLDDMKPRMAQVGIFFPEDKNDEELNAILDEYQGISLDPFQSPSNFVGMVIQFAHAVTGQYQTQMFLHYACESLICTSAKTLDYIDKSESTNVPIILDSRVTVPNNLEFRLKVGNLQASNWQSGYHQGIHYDPNWNYIHGETSTSYKYYPYNQYKEFTVADSINADVGEQTYQYLYFYP